MTEWLLGLALGLGLLGSFGWAYGMTKLGGRCDRQQREIDDLTEVAKDLADRVINLERASGRPNGGKIRTMFGDG